MAKYPWIELILAAYLGISGTRKRSLSPSGGIAAFVVGFLMMAVPLRTFGVSLIVFYLTGSKATKVGKELKAKLEEGHQEAGYRNWSQVLCNSFSAFVASVLWTASYVPESLLSSMLSSVVPHGDGYNSEEWCAVSQTGWSRTLVFVSLGHFACCLGDTLASELGILSKSPPRLITTGKAVPPGTNGGVSVAGTLASVAGGLVMGLTAAVTLFIESAACRRDALSLIPVMGWGALAGLLGSLLDSLMGATIQRTKFSSTTKRILIDESPAPANNADIRVISGLDILTNNQVNLLSSIVTAVILGKLA
ncbi:integral membrane protein DUF92-domain-containing protein [Cristinia sonorae]|uniref:Integral membrane protein DUF92-domain-containing protein n=1 Tax=Cristinia sonorae TaxID=1940300 RepID=A0A8K0UML4_9AGAR|nr:integral membrane protein DUF92-domain-containing protein [Cristinia sonorae]